MQRLLPGDEKVGGGGKQSEGLDLSGVVISKQYASKFLVPKSMFLGLETNGYVFVRGIGEEVPFFEVKLTQEDQHRLEKWNLLDACPPFVNGEQFIEVGASCAGEGE